MENAAAVLLGTERCHARLTPKRRLREVDFMFDGNEIRGLEQNPDTKSRWAQMARRGKNVMQFRSGGLRRQRRWWDGEFVRANRGGTSR